MSDSDSSVGPTAKATSQEEAKRTAALGKLMAQLDKSKDRDHFAVLNAQRQLSGPQLRSPAPSPQASHQADGFESSSEPLPSVNLSDIRTQKRSSAPQSPATGFLTSPFVQPSACSETTADRLSDPPSSPAHSLSSSVSQIDASDDENYAPPPQKKPMLFEPKCVVSLPPETIRQLVAEFRSEMDEGFRSFKEEMAEELRSFKEEMSAEVKRLAGTVSSAVALAKTKTDFVGSGAGGETSNPDAVQLVPAFRLPENEDDLVAERTGHRSGLHRAVHSQKYRL